MLKTWLVLVAFVTITSAYETVYAVSYGHKEVNHTDSLGVFYTHTKKDCIQHFDYENDIKNIPIGDRPLYQGYCYNLQDNSIKIPLAGTGRYLLVVKFRTWSNFQFDMVLNKKHNILRNFDTMSGKDNSDAFDVTAVFTVCGDRLMFNNEISTIIDNNMELEFNFTKGDLLFVPLSAIGLFKKSDGKELPASLATNVFKCNDWSQQTLFTCSDNQIIGKPTQVAPSVTINFYYNFVLNIEDNNLNKDSLVQDEF